MTEDAFAGSKSSARAKTAYVPVGKDETVGRTLGINTSAWFRRDPKAMAYTAAKYKFVAKMLEGSERVLEVGCGDGFGAPIVAQHVKRLYGVDFYKPHIEEAHRNLSLPNVEFRAGDFFDGNGDWPGTFNAIYALDVLEHVDPAQEAQFLTMVVDCLVPDGVFICGMPTLASQAFASEYNRAAHINCQNPADITATLKKYFKAVFSFGMNDEVLHTGFDMMRQYQLNLCACPRG